jgi:hypothetical protein
MQPENTFLPLSDRDHSGDASVNTRRLPPANRLPFVPAAEIRDISVNLALLVYVLNCGAKAMIERLGLLSMLLALLVAPARAAEVTGRWRVTISTANGPITGVASFKRNGHAVTGWVGPSENDPIPITGVLRGNKLTLETFPQPGRTVAFHKCDVAVSRDKMVGTIDTDKGTIEFARSAPTKSRR